MRTSRIHVEQPLQPGGEAVVHGPAAHYLGRVLRAVPGQPLILFNGDGHDYAAEITRIGRAEVHVAVSARLPGLAESPLRVTVVQGISRGERMDQTLQKCTELGAAAFQPVFCERSEVRLSGEKLQKRRAHWRGVVISACEQCGRSRLPELLPALSLADWLASPAPGTRVVLEPGAEQALARFEPGTVLELAVGPEGGFSGTELDAMRRAGVAPVALGPRILRTETAAPAALAVLQFRAGDLG